VPAAGFEAGVVAGGAADLAAAGVCAGMSDGFTNAPLLPQPEMATQAIGSAINRTQFLIDDIVGRFMWEV
jgi:hypothetical protein